MISAGLVMLVVFLFLGSARAALIPSLAIPVSLIGTFAIMYLYGFSLNNLSLMALIVAAGLVVDDAIVVLENISRHIERGLSPVRAAMRGSAEVGFTLLAMNLSLVAVFISILFMGGLVEIEQVLVNLLLNARDALGESSDRKVEIRGASRDDKVMLTVADTGGGIPPQIISRIFDPFFTTKPAGKGTGLGLAISQKTMIALGGAIAVRNTETGAEFTLVFQALKELE
jgi:signal transduction histidine kinase